MKKIKRVGLIGNSDKLLARKIVNQAARLIAKSGRTVFCNQETAKLAGFKVGIFESVAELTRQVDLLIVFGGDGTMLRAASEVGGIPTPVLGINIGGLGFLTAVSSDEMAAALQQIWDGNYAIESRPLIEVAGEANGVKISKFALNDFVISRGMDSRLITLEVSVNGEPLTRYRCDGLIVSSPTGSTAYALSAGGAVVHPQAPVFQLTPICPHTLSNRSVIVSLDSRIQVKVASPKPETVISADGEGVSSLVAGEVVTIYRSRKNVQLLHLKGTSFFDTLRRKLHWSGAYV